MHFSNKNLSKSTLAEFCSMINTNYSPWNACRGQSLLSTTALCYLSRRSYIALTSDQVYRWQPRPVTQPSASVQSAACVVHRRMNLAESNARSLDVAESLPLRTAALTCSGAFSYAHHTFTHQTNTNTDQQCINGQNIPT